MRKALCPRTNRIDMYDFESDIIGASCELRTPWRGYTQATVIEDYGNQLLVRMSSGAEITVYRNEVRFL